MNKDKKSLKIAQVSTWDVPCGIAGYTKALVNGLLENQDVQVDVIAIDRQILKYSSLDEMKVYFLDLAEQLANYDVVHLQHEFSFFAGSYGMSESIAMFGSFLKKLKKPLSRKIFVTFHSELVIPSSTVVKEALKAKLLKLEWQLKVARLFNSNANLNAIVHTRKSRRIFIDIGFQSESISLLTQGVTFSGESQFISHEEKNLIKNKLGFDKDTVLLSLFGFISSYKGHHNAIEALKFLPENYHLLIIGGLHPHSQDHAFNHILTYLDRFKKLKNRVKLTGYLPLNVLQEYYKAVDFCLAPYQGSTNLSSSAAITWALTSGRPVIASNIPAFEELNEIADCLCLVTPDCPGELAYKVQELVANHQEQERLVSNALKYCSDNQWSNVAKQHIELYTDVSKKN